MFTIPAVAAAVEQQKKIIKSTDDEAVVKPMFSCPVCDITFNRRFNRDRHVEGVHKLPKPAHVPIKVGRKPGVKKLGKKPEEQVPKEEVEKPSVTQPEKIPGDQSDKPPILPEKTLEMEITVEEEVPKKEPIEKDHDEKKVAMKRPADPLPATPAKKPTQPEDLPVTKLPIQHIINFGKSMMPAVTIQYCGMCEYPKKHKVIHLSTGHAMVVIPLCKNCKELNLAVTDVVKHAKKQ